jgi:translocation protein SEC72
MGDPERPSRLGHHSPSGFGRRDDDDEYALLHQSELDDGGHAPTGAYDPTAPSGGMPPSGRIMHDYDTGYGGPYGRYGSGQPGDEFGGSTAGGGMYGR